MLLIEKRLQKLKEKAKYWSTDLNVILILIDLTVFG